MFHQYSNFTVAKWSQKLIHMYSAFNSAPDRHNLILITRVPLPYDPLRKNIFRNGSASPPPEDMERKSNISDHAQRTITDDSLFESANIFLYIPVIKLSVTAILV